MRKLQGNFPNSLPSILQCSLMRKGLFVASSSLFPSRLSSGAFINHFLSSRNPSPPHDYPPCNESKVEISQGITFFRDLCVGWWNAPSHVDESHYILRRMSMSDTKSNRVRLRKGGCKVFENYQHSLHFTTCKFDLSFYHRSFFIAIDGCLVIFTIKIR